MTSIGLRHSGLKRQSLTKALQLDPVLPQNFARLLRCACASVPPFRSITLIDPTLSESQVTKRDEYPEHEPPCARNEAAQANNRAVGIYKCKQKRRPLRPPLQNLLQVIYPSTALRRFVFNRATVRFGLWSGDRFACQRLIQCCLHIVC